MVLPPNQTDQFLSNSVFFFMELVDLLLDLEFAFDLEVDIALGYLFGGEPGEVSL